MKKTLLIIITAFMVIAMTSCGDVIEIPEDVVAQMQPSPEPDSESISGEVKFTATVKDVADNSFIWEKGIQAVIFDGKATHRVSNAVDGQVAEFTVTVSDRSERFIAFVPSRESVVIDSESIKFNISDNITIDSKSQYAMAGTTTTSHIAFNPVTAKIAFTVAVDGITEVEFNSYDSEISGDVVMSLQQNGKYDVAASRNTVRISGDFVNGNKYEFEVLATELKQGYSLVMSAGEDELSHKNVSDPVSLTAGSCLDLGEVKEDNQIFRVTNIWLWGGTGPEYDCTKIYDLYEKSSVFDATDGRGIEAVRDNYIEFASEGVFHNWAGEDARHWWMALDKEATPNKKKSLDMASLYGVLPKNEGKWSQQGNVYTLTNENGEVVTAELVPAGEYSCPGTEPELKVKITRQALKFTIKGGADDWDNTSSDYGVIYSNPRVLYLELEKLPAGSVVPEPSRTKDEVVFVEKPDNPFPEFDLGSLAGSYNVYGGNSAPFGLFVLGGSGDDPAFVSPVEKSWCFGDSIWKESDNGLVIKVSESGSASVKGTLNYWCGNDGGFWDYTWHAGKSDAVDMSSVYGILPHGEKGFVLDVEEFMVTIDGSKQARLLVPGVHKFSEGNKTITIEEGCIGLDFKIMDMIPPTDKRWSDIDRFVNAPLHYVMIFQKEN